MGVTGSTVVPRPVAREGRAHPRLYFGGASAAAEQVAATDADVQLFRGEPLDGIRERIERLQRLGEKPGRELPALQFGLRITTPVRDTTEQAWPTRRPRTPRTPRSRAGARSLSITPVGRPGRN